MQHLLLVTILLVAVGLSVMVLRVGAGKGVTFSLHAVVNRKMMVGFAMLLSVAAGSLFIFNTWWLAPMLKLGVLYQLIFSLGLVLTLLVAWIPDTAGWRRRIHRLAAYGIVLVIPVIVGMLLTRIHEGGLTYALAWFVLIMLLAMCGLLFFVPAARRYFLPLQALYLGLFFATLLAVTYL